MNKNLEKGFTLVELLAVIVILAIILVIAVPKVMSVIEDSKKATLESTAKMIASSAEKQKVQNTVLGNTNEITCDSVAKINSGDYASCSVSFDNNTAKVTIEGSGKFEGLWVCSGTKTGAIASKNECPSQYALSSLATTSTEVTSINACASKGEVCTNGTNGTNPTMFAIKVNNTEVYNFYVIADDGNEITLIMDRNLGETVKWNSDLDIYEPDVALPELVSRTSGWSNIPERDYVMKQHYATYSDIEITSRSRMLTTAEAVSLGCTITGDAVKEGCPSYLLANLNEHPDQPIGYWIPSATGFGYAEYIGNYYYFGFTFSSTDWYIGVRPVITLEK